MSPVLLRQRSDPEQSIELTPEGHEFALLHDHDDVIARFAGEAGDQADDARLSFAFDAFPISETDYGGRMPPVISWMQDSKPDDSQRSDRFLLHLLANQPCFQGHFPDQPILPGIVQLHWAVKLADTCLGRPSEPDEILRLKYHNIAVPPRFIELQLESGEGSAVQFRMQSKDGVHAQGKLVYGGSD